jgi:hypothetical protein
MEKPYGEGLASHTNDRFRRAMVTGYGARSVVALIPDSRSLSVVVGILGSYLGMLNVPADTRGFPNTDDFRWGHFMSWISRCPSQIRFGSSFTRWLNWLDQPIAGGKPTSHDTMPERFSVAM